jgi:segregation and condensation protein B
MERSELKTIVEALIFVAEEPLTEQAMLKALEPEGVDKAQLREAIAAVQASWNENPDCGLKLIEVAHGYQFRTKEAAAEWIKRMYEARPARLSQAAMETMAIVAYRQPIIRSEIEHIRGVDSGGVLKTLLERRLIRIVGKRDEPGQPLIYGTTKEFLELFGLNTLKDMPPLADLRELADRYRETRSNETSPEQDGEDDEESTQVIGDDESDEPTEVISRLEKDETDDKEALAHLEHNLKSVRKLERLIFPKPVSTTEPSPEGTDGAETKEGQSAAATDETVDARASQQTDRSVE